MTQVVYSLHEMIDRSHVRPFKAKMDETHLSMKCKVLIVLAIEALKTMIITNESVEWTYIQKKSLSLEDEEILSGSTPCQIENIQSHAGNSFPFQFLLSNLPSDFYTPCLQFYTSRQRKIMEDKAKRKINFKLSCHVK